MIVPENTTGLVLLLFIIATFWLIYKRQITISYDKYLTPFIVLYFIYLLSFFYSENVEEAKVKLTIKFPLLMLPMIMHFYLINVDRTVRYKLLKNLVTLFALATPYFLLTAAYRSIKAGSLYYTYPESGEVISSYFTYIGLSEWVIHPAYLSLWVGTMLLISTFLLIKTTEKTAYLLKSASLFILLILLQSRMNILAFFIVSFPLLVIFLLRNFSFKINMIVILVLAIFGIAMYHLVPDSLKGRFSDLTTFEYNIEAETFHEGFNGITIRLAEWKCALEEIVKRPIFGSGVGDARFDLETSYLRNNFKYGYREKFNAHNQLIETTLATGLLGLLALISVFVYSIVFSLKQHKWHAIAAIMYIFLCFLTESYLERQWGVVFFSFIIPIVLESEIDLPESKNKSQKV